MRNSTVSMCPSAALRCRADRLSQSKEFGLAPTFTRSLTFSRSPLQSEETSQGYDRRPTHTITEMDTETETQIQIQIQIQTRK